jgi:glucokinase
MRVIAGDVGGTKVLLQYIEVGEGGRTVRLERRYESRLYPTFDRLLREFLALGVTSVDSACFAVAGPVTQQVAEVTNIGWKMDAASLQTEFGIPRVILINDFYAVAVGVPLLRESDLVSLNRGVRDRDAPIAVLGAGTGLGEAAVIPFGDQWRVVPSEGGHADFAPQGQDQIVLYRALKARYRHVSNERLLSGEGLANIYLFLRDRARDSATGLVSIEEMKSLPARISAKAREGEELARRAFEIFVDIYGAEAGNMALRLLPRGGVFLAGGIAAKNVEQFTDGRFMRAFTSKGRFAELLREVPVDLISNENAGLMGASETMLRSPG